MKKTVVMMLAMLLMMSISAYADTDKNKGWFVYGIFEHESLETGIVDGGMIRARNTLFGIGAEKTFSYQVLRKLRLEVMTGKATVDEIRETKKWSGIPPVLVYHTREYLTHRHGGRWKAALASELSLGKRWYALPSASWSNSWMTGVSQSEYAVRIGKRF